MNFSAWETINDAINAGYKFWTVYDATGKRTLYKNEIDETPEASAERLKLILSRETGEFVQIRLSQKTGEEVNKGGNIRGFVYYYRLNQAPGITASHAAPAVGLNGVPLDQYISALNQANAEKMERLKIELTANQSPSFIERIATPENVNKFFDIAGALVNALGNKRQISQPAIAEPTGLDQETAQAVNALLSYEDGRQALINIAAAGPMVWSVIRQGLIENKLLP